MKASEFVKQYCEKAGWTEKEFYESQVPMPDSTSPSGWAAVSNSPLAIKAHVDLYMRMPLSAQATDMDINAYSYAVREFEYKASGAANANFVQVRKEPPALVVSIDKVKLGEWLDSEVGGVSPEQYDFYLKSFYENVMPAPVADSLMEERTVSVKWPDDGMDDCYDLWGAEQCRNNFDCGYNFSAVRHEQAIREALAAAGIKLEVGE